MAHIYIYSPSSAVRDKLAFKRGLARLKHLGHDVEVDTAALSCHMRFAGDDATRVAAIHRAAASGADVTLTSRGGYGLTRILTDINYKAVAASIAKGTQWVGLSDFTALQAALLAKTGAVTWAGPAVAEDFGCGYFGAEGGAQTSDDIMEACFDDVLSRRGEGAGWRLPMDKSSAGEEAQKNTKSAIKNVAVSALSIRDSGKNTSKNSVNLTLHNATLWGGNLNVLTALLGTPYLPQIDKGVLFFEDVGEHPYRIERMLTTWLHAGILQRQKAIILGQFTNFKLVKGYDRGFNMASVAAWLRTKTKTPILTGLPFGHVPTKVCLPVGAKVSLITEGRDALVLWGDLV